MYYIGCPHKLEKKLREEPIQKVFFPTGEFKSIEDPQDGVSYQYVVSKAYDAVFLVEVEVSDNVQLDCNTLLGVFQAACNDMRRYNKNLYAIASRDTSQFCVGEALLVLTGFQRKIESFAFSKLLDGDTQDFVYELKPGGEKDIGADQQKMQTMLDDFQQRLHN